MPQGFDWAQTGAGRRSPWRSGSRWACGRGTGALRARTWRRRSCCRRDGTGPPSSPIRTSSCYFEWNKSFVYVLTAAYFATRLEGAPVFDAGNPSPALSGEQIEGAPAQAHGARPRRRRDRRDPWSDDPGRRADGTAAAGPAGRRLAHAGPAEPALTPSAQRTMTSGLGAKSRSRAGSALRRGRWRWREDRGRGRGR